jgi:hypothetical protein
MLGACLGGHSRHSMVSAGEAAATATLEGVLRCRRSMRVKQAPSLHLATASWGDASMSALMMPVQCIAGTERLRWGVKRALASMRPKMMWV